MWLPAITVAAAAGEPLTAADVRDYLRIDGGDLDGQIADWIIGARGRIERTTGTRLLTQTVKLQAGSFDDLSALPIGPVTAIQAITYQDAAGQAQPLDASAWELFGGELAWGIRPAAGRRWPAARAVPGAIAVTAVVGYGAAAAIPGAVRIAMLQLVRGLMDGVDVDVDAWIANDRLWL